MTSLTLSDLKAARALIADESRWCKHTLARNEHCDGVGPCDADACMWCASGALAFVTGGSIASYRCMTAERELVFSAGDLGIGEENRRNVPHINDTSGHEAIMRMFDHAIRRESKGE